jgi:hypothetical protein
VWYEPLVCYRIPKPFNLRMDPYERADVVSNQYDQWRIENAYLMGWVTFHAAAFLDTFVKYPPSQEHLPEALAATGRRIRIRSECRCWHLTDNPTRPRLSAIGVTADIGRRWR